MDQEPDSPPDKSPDRLIAARPSLPAEDASPSEVPEGTGPKENQAAPAPGHDPRIEQAEARVERAEKRTERAEVRTEEAKVRTEHAEARTQQAEVRIDQAETRIEQAETRIGEAEARTEQAKARTEEAKARTEQAEMRTEQIETRIEQAETRSEQAVGSSELKYRRLFEAARDGILILDADTGRINDVNPFLIELLGFSHAEMIGRTVGELSPSKDLEWNKVMLSRLQEQGYVRYDDLPLEAKDGRRVAVEFVSNVYEAGARKVIQCNIRDITQRKHAEMASSRLAAIVESSDDAIIGKDLNSNVSSWNQGAEKIFGYTAAEMVGTSIRRLIPDDRQDEEEQQILGRIRGGESVGHFETRRRAKDGRTVGVSITASPIRDDTGEVIGVSIIARDITARRQAEESLHLIQANMAVAQRISHIGSWELDLTDANDIDANALRWSDEMFRIAGYEPGAVAVTNELFFSRIPEPEHAPIRAAIAEAIGERERYSIVHQLIRPDGEVRIVHEEGQIFFQAKTGQPAKIVGTAQDITDRRRAEATRDRLTAILENTPDIVSIAELSGQLLYLNPAGRKLLGVDPLADITTTSIAQFIPDPASHPILLKGIPAAIRDGVWRGETTLLKPDGETFPVSQVIVAHSMTQGKIDSVSTIMRDISAEKRTEKELRSSQENLRALNADLERRVEERTADLWAATRESERANSAKSEFLSRMSHELRTPLHAILGFGQLLEMDCQNDEDKESVMQIVRAGKHLLGLINEVLDLALVESGKLELTCESVHLGEALEETLSLVRPLAAERGVRLEPPTGDLDCEVFSSTQRFKQVLLNLLSNAIKYNRPDGTVTLSCQKMEDRIRLEVADTGAGISAENIAKLFTPFERLDQVGTMIEGSGLGLTLSKHLIKAMGGGIGVESKVGEGTTIWIELPLSEGTPPTTERKLDAPVSKMSEKPRSTAPRTLLYIEDNLSNLRLVERILARRPEVKLISATQGNIGLELARQHQPDLILLDLHLPDMQGDEILRHLRADPATAAIPIVMISADATAAQIERLRAAGADDYLTKPIDIRKFLALVDAVEPRPAESAPSPGTPALR